MPRLEMQQKSQEQQSVEHHYEQASVTFEDKISVSRLREKITPESSVEEKFSFFWLQHTVWGDFQKIVEVKEKDEKDKKREATPVIDKSKIIRELQDLSKYDLSQLEKSRQETSTRVSSTEKASSPSTGAIAASVDEAEETIRNLLLEGFEAVKEKVSPAEEKQLLTVDARAYYLLSSLCTEMLKVGGINDEYTRLQLTKKIEMWKEKGNATMIRLQAMESREISPKEYDEHADLDESKIMEMARRNAYNPVPVGPDVEEVSRIWGKIRGEALEIGRPYGYIMTWNSRFINLYLRAKAARQKAPEEDKSAEEEYKKKLEEIKDEARKNGLKQGFFKGSESEEEAAGMYASTLFTEYDETVTAMDSATEANQLEKEQKVYRMVDERFLSWALHMNFDTVKKMSTAERTEAINNCHGMIITDHGYMSTGYCMDEAFLQEPIMLTLLTPKDKKCFVTSNFTEAEIIFPKGTKYQVIQAIDHSASPKVMKVSKPKGSCSETESDAEEIRSYRYGDFKGIEVIVSMLPDKDKLGPAHTGMQGLKVNDR